MLNATDSSNDSSVLRTTRRSAIAALTCLFVQPAVASRADEVRLLALMAAQFCTTKPDVQSKWRLVQAQEQTALANDDRNDREGEFANSEGQDTAGLYADYQQQDGSNSFDLQDEAASRPEATIPPSRTDISRPDATMPPIDFPAFSPSLPDDAPSSGGQALKYIIGPGVGAAAMFALKVQYELQNCLLIASIVPAQRSFCFKHC